MPGENKTEKKTYEQHKEEAPASVNCAIMVISDSISEKLKEDVSGKLMAKELEAAGHKIISYEIIPDDRTRIFNELMERVESDNVDAIITSGGTGIAKRDITLETVSSLFEKRLEGFGEVFRFISYQEIGSPAFLSRAACGTIKGKPVFCLPGSPAACELAVKKLIAPELGHLVKHARS